jgi:hypothetical protein
LKRTRPPKVTEIHRWVSGAGRFNQLRRRRGKVKTREPPPQYRQVAPCKENDETSDPNRPQPTP